jgi:hypothetical protein
LNATVLLVRQIRHGFSKISHDDLGTNNNDDALLTRWRGERRCVSMDILAAIFVYLASVSGIVAALAISFVLYFSPTHQAASVKQAVAMVVQQSGPKAAPSPQPAAGGVTTQTQEASQKIATPSAVTRAQAMRAQYLRGLAQEQRAKRWAYQSDASFENRFLGYAD